ncbi:MAG: glycerophosphodiester phosphodiesterase [Flavobacteriales bacterium]|nr:glycerophosphodiester phosphodiesterase [Flavobacteriales bacterium]
MALDRSTLSTALLAIVLIPACTMPHPRPEVHGHRGCRGLLPENSMPAFLKATELGVDYLEMDVVISGDGQVVISHEPWMNQAICQRPDGTRFTAEEERSFNLFRMSVPEIQAFDCGSMVDPAFPGQELETAHKPTLRELIELVDEHAMLSSVPTPGFNIEIKSDPALYGTYQPTPAIFAMLVLETIDSLGIADRCIIQSFDPAILEVVHKEREHIRTALLVDNTKGWKANLAGLTFQPEIYSPRADLIDAKAITELHAKSMEVIVWTVNDPKDIHAVIKLGVDGIISDYPDRVIAILDGD